MRPFTLADGLRTATGDRSFCPVGGVAKAFGFSPTHGMPLAKGMRPIGLTIMSNVPAYPKNPALYHDAPPQGFVGDSDEPLGESTKQTGPFVVEDHDLSPPPLTIQSIVGLAPIPVILLATGIGFVAGRLGRL